MRPLFILMSIIVLSVVESIITTYNHEEDIIKLEWSEFKSKYNKTYKNETEDLFRKRIYLENRHMIAKHNAKYHSSNLSTNEKPSFKLGLNQYADIFENELRRMNGFKPHLKKSNGSLYVPANNGDLPTEIDWRSKGYVSEIKAQGDCGSCCAFSATGSLESLTYLKTGNKVSLSEQNLIDCSIEWENMGCHGGLMNNAFEYIKDNKGIDSEKSYPYEAHDEECRYKAEYKSAEDFGFVDIESGDEDALMNAVASVGPISVAIQARLISFMLYKSGVHDDPDCSNDHDSLDHGVLVVGYGVDKESGKKYWLVKNSWGSEWGEEGYAKMVRGKKNQCGIATMASYPKL